MTNFQTAYEKVKVLVEQFKENEAVLVSDKYQESQVRTDYLDKFFSALGWDVRHKYQTNPREQEVQIESNSDSLSNRKVDYAFFLAPDFQRPVFLVEAKKPKHDLSNADYYFQTIRYGYNRSTSISILTDFQEFHIVDCRRKPERSAGITKSAQIRKYEYTDYLDEKKFGEIYWLFSREAVEQGKLTEYRKSLPKPKGIAKFAKLTKGDQLAPPDDEFLADLDGYREKLAKALYKTNSDLNAEELTASVQAVLDRLVFIRFLEDKLIEPDFIVDRFLNPGAAWQNFLAWSRKLDKKYNGIVFKPHFIDKSECNAPDDGVFFDICESISHKESPYLLNYIPVEILGSIYERFLGKVIVPKGRGVAVEEKPEVRKAGGVYYTPKYIVDYIVENTVGKILQNNVSPLNKGGDTEGGSSSSKITTPQPPPSKGGGVGLNPKQVAKLRFADIACGSGSFLIAIFDHINRYLEEWYNLHPADAKKDGCVKTSGDRWTLSLAQKRDILKNNIYGVDLDAQAVEVAQFSLFLKLLEAESISSTEVYQGELKLADKTILPDLSKNILCGNSLVEYDILDNQIPLSLSGRGVRGEGKMPEADTTSEESSKPTKISPSSPALLPKREKGAGISPEDERRIKPFDFRTAFKDIMSGGGFDAIVGNPPWIFTKYVDWGEDTKGYIQSKFLEHREAIGRSKARQSGKINYYAIFLLRSCQLTKSNGRIGYIIPNTILRTTVYDTVRKILLESYWLDTVVDLGTDVFAGVTASTVILNLQVAPSKDKLVTVLAGKPTEPDSLSQVNQVLQSDFLENSSYVIDLYSDSNAKRILQKCNLKGTKLGQYADVLNGIATQKNMEGISDKKVNSLYKPLLQGRDIARYSYTFNNKFIEYDRKKLLRARDESIFLSPEKLIMQRIGGILITAYDDSQYYTFNSVNNLLLKEGCPYSLKFLLGIIDSKLLKYIYTVKFTNGSSLTVNISKTFLDELPIPTLDLTNPSERKQHDTLVNLVEQMLDAKKRFASARTDTDRSQIERKCEWIDNEIDKLVYGLYGLTEEEIVIVERRDDE